MGGEVTYGNLPVFRGPKVFGMFRVGDAGTFDQLQ